MLEKIPAYSQLLNKSQLLKKSSAKTASAIDLAPVAFSPSHNLWLAECAIYGAIFISASVALVPFFLAAFYWPILWLIFSALIALIIRNRWRAKNSSSIMLDITQHNWRLRKNNSDIAVIPFDDVLLWSWVIILPLKENISGKKHYFVLLQDSVSADDWRRLRVWLRTCFK